MGWDRVFIVSSQSVSQYTPQLLSTRNSYAGTVDKWGCWRQMKDRLSHEAEPLRVSEGELPPVEVEMGTWR